MLRSASPAVRSLHATWRSSSSTAGQLATIIARTLGSSPRPGLVCMPITSVQSLACESERFAPSHVSSIRSANGTSSAPARVSRTSPRSRSNSGTPSCRSSARICLERAGWLMYSVSAARVKCSSRGDREEVPDVAEVHVHSQRL